MPLNWCCLMQACQHSILTVLSSVAASSQAEGFVLQLQVQHQDRAPRDLSAGRHLFWAIPQSATISRR